MHAKLVAAAFFLAGCFPCFADQCIYNNQKTAEDAVRLLPIGTALRHFCAPCGDKSARVDIVHTATIEKIPDDADGQYFVKVNGSNVDLAYVFIGADASGWSNLAHLAKCDAYEGSGGEMPNGIQLK